MGCCVFRNQVPGVAISVEPLLCDLGQVTVPPRDPSPHLQNQRISCLCRAVLGVDPKPHPPTLDGQVPFCALLPLESFAETSSSCLPLQRIPPLTPLAGRQRGAQDLQDP